MTLSNENVETALRVLNKYSAELQSIGPWRWRCVVQNGAALPLMASLEEGFLQITAQPEAEHNSVGDMELALRINGALTGGVKFTLNANSRSLHLRTDIALVEEARFLNRVHWAIEGFHAGLGRLECCEPFEESSGVASTSSSAVRVGEILRDTSWSCTERGPGEFSVDLHQDAPHPARITANVHGVVLSVDMVRCDPVNDATKQALDIYLLTASSAMRMAHAHAAEVDGARTFGMQVSLPPDPATEEIEHALAALSLAHRMCAREANVLLDPAAARCYLAARGFPSISKSESEKEN